MANILNLITIGEKTYRVVDADPSSAGGTAAEIGSLAIWDNGTVGRAYLKTGSADTAWDQVSTSGANGTVNSGTAGRVGVYAASSNAISDTYTQNSQGMTVSHVSQPSRSAAIVYQIPNPGNAVTSADFVLTEGAQTINGAKTLTSPLNMGGNAINAVADPSSAQDAATKAYVDAVAQGLSWKQEARAATTANITLSGAQTIDGVSVIAGDRVLVKNQSTQSQNGIYVAAAGAWSRALDMDTAVEFLGAAVFVGEGTINGDTAWTQITDAPITVGTTAIVWTQFAGAGTYTAGNGLSLTGTQFSINLATASGLQFTSGALDHLLDSTPYATLSKSASGLRVAAGGIRDNEIAAAGTANIARNKLASGTANHVIINDASGVLSSEAQLALSRGGTNANLTAVAGGIVYSGASALAISAAGTTGQALLSGGTGAPSWFTATGVVKATAGVLSTSNVSLTSEVSGVLPIANGGTNSSTALNNNRIMVSSGGAIVEAAALTNGQLLIGSTGAAPVAAAISGTANQVIVTNGAGSITLSLPQNINTGASPTFVGLTLSGLTAGSVTFAGVGGLISQNNTNFFWDNTNTRLGLGTNTPGRLLDVNGSSIFRASWRLASAAATKANYEMFQAQVSTTDATVTTLDSVTIATDSAALIEAKIVGRRTGGTSGTAQDAAVYVRSARFRNQAGTLTIQNLQSDYTSEDQNPWNATLDVNGTSARIRVTGAANNNIDWTVTYSVITL
jgi:hypothetical protein